jgi:hypothetical protein
VSKIQLYYGENKLHIWLDDVRFVLDQYSELDINSASSLKQRSEGNYTQTHHPDSETTSKSVEFLADKRQLPTSEVHVRVSRFLVLCMFCRSLFVLLYFFFWSLSCLFFFDIRILITLWHLQTLLIVCGSTWQGLIPTHDLQHSMRMR